MKVVDYDYIQEISTADALKAAASDVSSGYNGEIPGVNTFKINAETSIYNEQGGGEGLGIAGWSTDVRWTAGVGTISWSSGNIDLPDGTQIQVSSGSANVTAPTYIYVDTSDGTVGYTTHSYEAVGENKIMICSAFPNSGKNVTFQSFGNADQNSLTTGSSIANGTITANNIASGTITANEIASGTITANEIASNTITASEIASGAITSSKINVSELSAISANLGDVTAGTITGTTITAGDTDGSAIVLNPSGNRIDIYYGGYVVGQIYGGSNNGYDGIVLNADSVIMTGRDRMDLNNAKLRIPVGDDLY